MLAQLYLDYETRLKSIINPETGEPFFKHFDLWNRQVEFIEQETPFETPAVFFEFVPIAWRTMGQQAQDADLTIRLHIVTQWHGQTAEYTPAQIRQQMLDYLNAPAIVVNALQGFSTPFTNGLMRTKSIINHDHDRYVDSLEEYVCRIQDNSAMKKYVPAQVTPKIVIEKWKTSRYAEKGYVEPGYIEGE
jgi:hypothetical protein